MKEVDIGFLRSLEFKAWGLGHGSFSLLFRYRDSGCRLQED